MTLFDFSSFPGNEQMTPGVFHHVQGFFEFRIDLDSLKRAERL